MDDRQGLADILTNAITHGLGAVLAVVGAVFLIIASATGTALQATGCTIYGITLILTYISSTLYHSLVRTHARRCFRILDHSAIYLLIAGTYTPFALGPLHGRIGWILLIIVWTFAIAGVVFKSVAVDRLHVLSAIVYIGMGWLVVFATRPLVQSITWHGAAWLLAGGLCYTVGILFFAYDRVPFFHGIWHLFVLAGSAFHYFAVWFYVLPHER